MNVVSENFNLTITATPKKLHNRVRINKAEPLLQSENISGLLSGYASSIVSNLNQVNNTVNVSQGGEDSGLINLVSSKMDSLLDNISKNNQLQNDMLVYLRR